MVCMNPKISVIVPVYKVERYIKECVNSILASTFTDFELLLVDDGSPDNSGRICEEYAQKDMRIRVLHKPNGGVSSARNLGLDRARGEWVTFIDSDDLISPTFLEGLYRPIAKGENVDFVQGGNTNFEGGKPTTINYSFQDFVGTEKKVVLNDMVGLTVSKLFSLENVRRGSDGLPIRFDEKMSICEDMAFTYNYLRSVKRWAFVPETGYYYRRDNATSALHRLKDYQTSFINYSRLMDEYDSILLYFGLSYGDIPAQSRHKAAFLWSLLSKLYINGYTRKDRLSHLKQDLRARDFEICNYYIKDQRTSCFMRLLSKKNIILFDFFVKLYFVAVTIKHKIKNLKRYAKS